MKKTFVVMLTLCALIGTADALEINLSTDKKETEISADIKQVTIKTGETIKFFVKVKDAGSTGGAFTLSREVKANTYKLIGGPHFVIASCLCKGLKGGGDIDDYMSYVPTEPGKYRADATYGGHGKRIEFFVEGDPISDGDSGPVATTPVTTSSTSTSTSTTTTTTTTPMETTTTQAVEETTTTTYPDLSQNSSEATTTTIIEAVAIKKTGCGCQNNYLMLLAIPLALLFVYLGCRFNLIKK